MGWKIFDGRSKVDFNQDIRPILNQKCMTCHGGVRQQAGLSFLSRDAALQQLESGLHAIVPKASAKSALITRLKESDPELRMPPEGEPLSKEQIKLFEKWIDQGAEWKDHWSFVPPNLDIEPPTKNTDWGTNEIDQFVLDKLAAEDLATSKRADPEVLARRVSFDLIGLPIPPRLLDQFLDRPSQEGFENLVDSLLNSPHFGERWATMWLDLARYADSQGYQKDPLRKSMWAYRDWVIHALNKDMPFDQFTIEQIAGDLLPDATESQILATAFHRNTMTNDEGGTDDEEFRVAAVLDRVNTSFEVWQGVTMSCVQCHSHPYDPIQHEEYYQTYAVFNQTQDSDHPRDNPKLPLHSPIQQELRSALKSQIESVRSSGDTTTAAYQESLRQLLAIKAPQVPIMQSLQDSQRVTRLFERGNWLAHGKEVRPGVPAALSRGSSVEISDRLDFAKWLTSEANPLTARVMVNRLWEQFFGIGLVESLEDLGTQGYEPSHPEMLDWLAVQFSTKLGWSIKQIVRTIVLSATYQQNSTISDELINRDPYNRLLARGPRVRLSAEQIRDQALVVSGLFNPTLYGPSVMPYQPDGVWNTIRHVGSWESPKDDSERFRRGLYTFWRRVSPYPSMIAFDAPSRELCVSRRIRTNTPIQALITMNDPVYVEATEELAARMINQSSNFEEQVQFAYQSVLAREAPMSVVETLSDLYQKTLQTYQSDVQKDPDYRLLKHSQSAEMAAMTVVASVVMNLDEVVMKS